MEIRAMLITNQRSLNRQKTLSDNEHNYYNLIDFEEIKDKSIYSELKDVEYI